MRQKTEHLAMIFPNLHTEYGRVVAVGSSPRLEFWLRLDGVEELILSWQGGDCGLVLSVPHAGLLGQDRWELELFTTSHSLSPGLRGETCSAPTPATSSPPDRAQRTGRSSTTGETRGLTSSLQQ